MNSEMARPAIESDPRLLASWASFEGIPDDWLPLPHAAAPEPRGRLREAGHNALGWIGARLPGLGLAVGLAWLGVLISRWLGSTVFDVAGSSPVSPVLLAIALGLLIRNVFGVPAAYERGLRWCTTTMLRFGIVLLGLGLSITALAETGLAGIPIIAGCILTALIAVTLINRALKLPGRLGTLIAVGTSICGVSAIVATAPAIDADDDETSYAVACITIFGLVALLTYPFLANLLFAGDQLQAGLFLGTAIHDTAQVAGAGAMYRDQFAGDDAMKTAVTVKLVRNLSMSLLIPLLAVMYHRRADREQRRATGRGGGASRARRPWNQFIPLFVVGFAAMACLRSLGDRWAPLVMETQAWEAVHSQAGQLAVWCLAAAMAAVGLGTGFSRLRGLGWKPFTVGCAAAVLVGGASFVLITLFSRFSAG